MESQLKVFSELRCSGISPDVVAFNTVIRAQAKVGNTHRAGEILGQMWEEELRPNVVTFNSFFTSFHKDSEVEELSKMLRSMQDHEIKPDIVTYSTLINAHEEHSRWQDALAMFREMDACLLRPNKIAFTAAVRALRGSSSSELLEGLYSRMRMAVSLDLVAYNALISISSKWSLALSIFDDLKATLKPDVLSFNALLRTFRGRWRCTLEAWQQLRLHQLSPDALSCESALGSDVLAPRLLEHLEQVGKRKLLEAARSCAQRAARGQGQL